jgi:L-asparagine transporter-like permease
VKIYKWLFVLLTLAQMVFTITWLLLVKKADRVIILSSMIYAGCMLVGYISYEVKKYRKRKKELIDDLP